MGGGRNGLMTRSLYCRIQFPAPTSSPAPEDLVGTCMCAYPPPPTYTYVWCVWYGTVVVHADNFSALEAWAGGSLSVTAPDLQHRLHR